MKWTTWLAAVAMLLIVCPQADAQIDPRRPLQPKLLPAGELEIYQARVQNKDSRVGHGEQFTLAAGARNNGGLAMSFDYALGPSLNEVWWTAPGTSLAGGKRHIGGFQLSYNTLIAKMGKGRAGTGWIDRCFQLHLVRQGTTTALSDANNGNHRQRVCIKMQFPGT